MREVVNECAGGNALVSRHSKIRQSRSDTKFPCKRTGRARRGRWPASAAGLRPISPFPKLRSAVGPEKLYRKRGARVRRFRVARADSDCCAPETEAHPSAVA